MMEFSQLSLKKVVPALWMGVGAWIFYLISVVIYRIYFHPLSKFPGPFLGKFTEYHTYGAVMRDGLALEQDAQFKKYGSPCRISTNSLIFAEMKAWGDVLGQSSTPCLKDPGFYDAFTVTGERNLLNAVDKGHHARLRRLMSHGFSLKALLGWEALFASKIDEYVSLALDHKSKGEEATTIDIYEETHSLFLDIVSQLAFGKSFDCLRGQNLHVHRDLAGFQTFIPATSFVPGLRYLPIPAIREGFKGVERLKNFSRDKVSEVMQRNDKGDKEVQGTFLHKLIMAVDPDTGSKLTLEELVENAIIFLLAGSGTTAVTTCYFLWEMARTPDARKRLVDEIRSAFPDPSVMPTYERASQLPYLAASIEETLRLWGPINGAMPRVSPGRVIGEHFVPKGTWVGVIAYSSARDPQVFPDPGAFRPERWLAGEATAEMKTMSRPFSYGPRNCIGKHLAEITLTLTLARIYQLFDVEVDAAMTEEEMKIRDKGVFEPWGAKMLVRCTRVQK